MKTVCIRYGLVLRTTPGLERAVSHEFCRRHWLETLRDANLAVAAELKELS